MFNGYLQLWNKGYYTNLESFTELIPIKLPYHNFSLRRVQDVLLGADLRAESIDDGANLDQFVKKHLHLWFTRININLDSNIFKKIGKYCFFKNVTWPYDICKQCHSPYHRASLKSHGGNIFSIVQGKKLIYVFTNSKGVSISVKIGLLIILGFEG